MKMNRLKNDLATECEIKNLVALRYFLTIEVTRSKCRIAVSQRKYILDLLAKTGISSCRPSKTPINLNVKLSNKGE